MAERGKHHDSHLWKHAQIAHGGNPDIIFSMKVVNTFKDPLTCQVSEAV